MPQHPFLHIQMLLFSLAGLLPLVGTAAPTLAPTVVPKFSTSLMAPASRTHSVTKNAGGTVHAQPQAAAPTGASPVSACPADSSSLSARAHFPTSWWMEVARESAPSWEVLPQDAQSGEVVLSKRNELGLLSNFAATPFLFRGKRYASLEGFWQMMKFPEGPNDPRRKDPKLIWPHTRDEISQMVAFEAKRAGDIGSSNMKKLGIGWVSFESQQMEYRPKTPGAHYHLIVEAMWAKVRQNADVQKLLLSTCDLKLRADHRQEAGAADAWNYNLIWMEIRSALQKEVSER